MIRGYCKSNLDGFSCDVKSFCAVPYKGDIVVAKINGNTRYLKVSGITHNQTGDGIPFIEVELTSFN